MWEIAKLLFPQLIGQPHAVGLQIVLEPRQLSHLQNQRILDVDAVITMPVMALRIGQHECVAGVILGPRDGMAISKTVQLFGVDGEHGEPALQKPLYHGSTRLFHPHRHIASLDLLPFRIDDHDAVPLASPVHSYKPSLWIFVADQATRALVLVRRCCGGVRWALLTAGRAICRFTSSGGYWEVYRGPPYLQEFDRARQLDGRILTELRQDTFGNRAIGRDYCDSFQWLARTGRGFAAS